MSHSTASALRPEDIHAAVAEIFAHDMHARRVLSLGNAAVGAVHGVAMTVHAIGQGLASATGGLGKNAIKQVDRLLSNSSLDLGSEVFPS